MPRLEGAKNFTAREHRLKAQNAALKAENKGLKEVLAQVRKSAVPPKKKS